MSLAVRIPPELQQFLNLPGPQTLLMRGAPGSGKTTLALALLEAFKGDKLLVTSRVNAAELAREFPWLGHNGGREIQVVDTSRSRLTVHDVARTLERARDLLPAPAEAGEREAEEFLWLPTPLQEAWSRLTPTRPSLVVVDSWDALVEGFLGGVPAVDAPVPDRAHVERLLIHRMAQAPAHLVFILEREEQTSLDYLVNAVAVTQRQVADERMTRWLTLAKLRGVRIDNPNYPFSLEGGKFEGIVPLHPYETLRPGPPDPEPDPMPGHVWPGSADLAAAFGRLPLGKISLLEVDRYASPEVGNLICLPIVAHVLRAGGRVVFVPHSTETAADVYHGLAPAVARSRFLSHFRMVQRPGPPPSDEAELSRVVLPIEPPAPGGPASDPAVSAPMRFLLDGASDRAPSLLVLSLQGLLGLAVSLGAAVGPDALLRVPDVLQAVTRGGPLHVIVVGRQGLESMDALRAIARIRISMSLQQGRIFVHGIAPWTPNFVLVEGDGGRPYRLMRVV